MHQSGFYTILFHAVYENNQVGFIKHPYLYVSTDELRSSIETLISNKFTFIGPDDLNKQTLEKNKVLLTFDDGYFNNFLALDILEEFEIPAVFFLVKDQIERQKSFWWDVYFRNSIENYKFEKVYSDIQELKTLKGKNIERKLKKIFGSNCFDCCEDFDRPMTVNEVKKFAIQQYVHIGVHSVGHEILTNLNNKEVRFELAECKKFLSRLVEKDIEILSYPNGNYNSNILEIAKSVGFKYGLTTLKGINTAAHLSKKNGWLQIKRNVFPDPENKADVVSQVKEFVRIAHQNE